MQTVTVNFLLVQFKLPLIILILLCVLLGAFVMTLVNFSKGFSLKRDPRALKSNWKKKRKKSKAEEKKTTKKTPNELHPKKVRRKKSAFWGVFYI